MKYKLIIAVVMAAFSAPSLALNISLGNLSTPGGFLIGNSFDGPGTFVDTYGFSISNPANASTLVLEIDPLLNRLNLEISSVALSGVGSFAGSGLLNFGALAAGSYVLSITSIVSQTRGLTNLGVGYGGLLALTSARGVRSQVPEPSTLAIYLLGLLTVAFAVRRKPVRL